MKTKKASKPTADDLFGFVEDESARRKLKSSEERIRKSFRELFSGYGLSAEGVLNEVVHVSGYTGFICVHDINFYSFCEHHFLPFFGTASVTYEPRRIITGLGKIIRLVRDVHGRRLQIQELMTKEIAEDIMRVLGAKGVLVETKAKHLCTCSRGPGDDTAMTTVAYGCGSLRKMALGRNDAK
jgi:GTP cyclohydrolase I